MRQRITVILSIILLLVLAIPNKIFAITSLGGYTIEKYDIKMIVNEDNTFDITETITANFTGYNKHGIYRKIPLKNNITRTDGTKSTNRAKISNISVSDNYSVSNESGYKVIKIGSSSQTVTGSKTYTIKYTYNIGKDPLKNADELYFNLIGDEWDTSIDNITFTITMPKSFDASKLGFSSGKTGSTNSSNVTYNVNGNTIYGRLTNSLSTYQALTVRLTLPEGYFVGTSSNFDYFMLLKIGISLIFVIIAYGLWQKFGKDDIVVETLEFYPPDGLNSADVGFIYKGHSENKDIISLLIYLANKGYLKIEEYEEKTLKVFKSKNFRITKLKDYDGDNEDERTFFNGLFSGTKLREGITKKDIEEMSKTNEKITVNDLLEQKEKVTRSDLYNKFYLVLNKIRKHINRKENQEKIFEKASLGKRFIVVIMILAVFFLMGGLSIIKVGDVEAIAMILFFLISPLVLVYTKPNVGTTILACIAFVVIGLICFMVAGVNSGETFGISMMIEMIIESFSLIMLIIFLGIMKKRTEYGTEMLGKIKGFKNFLEVAEKPRLEQLVEEDPEYFYNILPYTYALGVSSKWMKKFEDIALEAPHWYYGYSNFSTREFNSFMNSTYTSISNAMASSPSESSGGSGGGSSGGGSGGGGGGSW